MARSLRRLEPGLRLRSYRLVERIGVGGQGEVWKAQDGQGQPVALKIRPRQDDGLEHRIRTEFELLRTLRIPNVVRVLTVDSDQGFVFFAMELARGQDLDAYVQEPHDLGQRVQRLAAAGAGLARALAGIHRLRLAHRDVKPANVLVHPGREGSGVAGQSGASSQPIVTVLDFGTSRFGAGSDDEDAGLVGSVHYMAPEQRIGLPHDHRVDLYALGVVLHEALSGTPARAWTPGARRRSLALIGPQVPLPLADLVDRLLSLDPQERPSAEEAQDLLERVVQGRSLRPAPWPSPVDYLGDPGRLLDGSAVVVGLPGSGRRRMVHEARLRWYRQGYRSVAGHCRPDQPWSALAEIIASLLGPLDAASRRELCAQDAELLAAAWPDLPLPAGRAPTRDPDPATLGRAVGRLLARAAPLAVVLWELEQADPGTARALPQLEQASGREVRIWATARRPGAGLRAVLAPRWSAELEGTVWRELLGSSPPAGERAEVTALSSLARIWRHLARTRGLPGPATPLPDDLLPLAVLDEPFPREVAERLVPDLRELLVGGHLLPWDAVSDTDPTDSSTVPRGREQLVFADAGTKALARSRSADWGRLALDAAQAWLDCPAQGTRTRRAAALSTWCGRPSEAVFRAAIRDELGRGRPGELDRWLRLRTLYLGPPDPSDFELSYARLLVDLELRPGAVAPADLGRLLAQASDTREQGLAAYLQVVWQARSGDRAAAAERGRAQARALAQEHPRLAADMLREVALANIARGELGIAVRDAREALRRSRQAALLSMPLDAHTATAPLSRGEVSAMTTLSAALLYAGHVREAVEHCTDGAARCRAAGLARGEGALLANQGIGLLFLGQRADADVVLARCRTVQGLHRDPIVLANLAVTQARLAVERGDLAAARVLADEGLTAAGAVGDPHLVGEAWCSVLEAAVHAADPAEAQRALVAYGADSVGSVWDHWPAVLARWRWLIGDLPGALRATEEPREGHGELCIRAERSRLLLIAGRYEPAARAARALADTAEAVDHAEIAHFAHLVAAAASGSGDAEVRPHLLATRRSGWVHLYLGALHLDAIRRRLRGENVDSLLRQLRARSRDVGHRLYAALARTEGW